MLSLKLHVRWKKKRASIPLASYSIVFLLLRSFHGIQWHQNPQAVRVPFIKQQSTLNTFGPWGFPSYRFNQIFVCWIPKYEAEQTKAKCTDKKSFKYDPLLLFQPMFLKSNDLYHTKQNSKIDIHSNMLYIFNSNIYIFIHQNDLSLCHGSIWDKISY